MSERAVVLRLRAEIADFKSKMAEASKSTEEFGKRTGSAIERNSASISTLSNQAGLLGVAMVAAAVVAVKVFADFDQSMSNVQAATHESAANMDLLRDAALDAGKRTVYSATEAAGAIEELAKAGISAKDILGGGLNGALDLAAAGNLDVAEAAGIAAVALKQFNLDGSEVPHVADLLAAGAGKAMGSVSDLGMALRQAGQVANSTGLSIEETTAGLSAFASAGLIGSDAGTSFKAMLQRLTPQSAEAQAKMDELGISAYDAGGNFVGLADFAGNLQGALKDLSPEQRNAALATIFGSDAVRAANVLYDEGAAGIAEWTAKVDDTGYAAITAGIRLDNLKGDLEELSGSVETALIGLGEGADGPLRWLVQGVTSVVNKLSEMPAAVQVVTLALLGAGGLVLLSVAGFGKLVVAISEAKVAMAALGISAKTAGIAVGAIGGALAIATLGVMAWASAQAEARARAQEFGDTLDTTTGALTDSSRQLALANLAVDKSFLWVNRGSALDAAEALGISLDLVAEAATGVPGAMGELNAELAQFDTRGVASSAAADALGLSTTQLNEKMGLLRDGVNQQATALAEAGRTQAQAAEAQGELAGEVDTTTAAVAAQITTLEDLIDLQSKAAGVVLSERDAQRALQGATDDATAALETNGATLDITTEAGRANQAALDDIAKASWDVIDSMQANGSTQSELQASMQSSRDAFVKMAIAEGMGADEANRLADEMGLIPTHLKPVVTVDLTAAYKAVREFTPPDKIMKIYGSVVMPNTSGTLRGLRAMATGGPVIGPGTGTSDSVPLWGSNGEYVIKADSVSHYGKSFFDGLNAQRFAVGGYVGGGSSTAAASQPGATVTLNAYGLDADKAVRRVMRQWADEQVPR